MHPFAGVVHARPPGEVGTGGLVLALDAKGELARPAWPFVGAGEVADECLLKVQLGVDAVVGEAVESRSCRVEHKREVTHAYPAVAAYNAYRRYVVHQPVLRLDGAVNFGASLESENPF